MASTAHIAGHSLSQRKIFETWWPLAASWLLMGLELPILAAVIARLPDPEIHLAAYGGVVFPLALLIESPVIMLLAASTALSKDWPSYHLMWRFMMWVSCALTVLHVLLAFTPLYYWVIVPIFRPPPEVVEPARLGLMIMTPWTWAIAYRRLNQGVLIRYGRSREVTQGTLARLASLVAVLGAGYVAAQTLEGVTGIVVGTSAIAVAVAVEAAYVGWRVHPVIDHRLRPAPLVDPPLSFQSFSKFYTPLILTSLLTLMMLPVGTAAISRMPNALESLAIWPVLSGFLFLLLSSGIAYNEVVVSLLDEPGSVAPLRRFAWGVAGITSCVLFLFLATPLSSIWFQRLTGLQPAMAKLARLSLWLSLLRPALNVIQNWYQGAIIHQKQTRGITEAVAIFLGISVLLLVVAVQWGRVNGLFAVQFAFFIGALAQTAWLWWRSRPAIKDLVRTDQEAASG